MNSCVLSNASAPAASAANLVQRKKNFRDYYFYAINQQMGPLDQLSKCDNCSKWFGSCCV